MPKKIDPELLNFYKNIKCLTCKSETIYDSDSPFANETREFIQQQLNTGKDFANIEQQLIAKYGNEIIMTPADDNLIWYAPFIILIFALALLRKKLT